MESYVKSYGVTKKNIIFIFQKCVIRIKCVHLMNMYGKYVKFQIFILLDSLISH